jgi:hypothetical protein
MVVAEIYFGCQGGTWTFFDYIDRVSREAYLLLQLLPPVTMAE